MARDGTTTINAEAAEHAEQNFFREFREFREFRVVRRLLVPPNLER